MCGNGVCESGESLAYCPQDCSGGGGGPVCGNNVCETGEVTACPQDCSSGGGSCGNGRCDAGEPTSCRGDCPTVSGIDLVPSYISWSPNPATRDANVGVNFSVCNRGDQTWITQCVTLYRKPHGAPDSDYQRMCGFYYDYYLSPGECFERGPNTPFGGGCQGNYGLPNAAPPGYDIKLLADSCDQAAGGLTGETDETNNIFETFVPVQ